MSSYISNVKNNIIEFVNEIDAAGITPYFALIDYKDITCDGQYSTNVKKNFDGSNWFKSAYDFKNEISKLSVSGGSDEPETVIDALEMARQLDLRESSHKFFIVVTDAGFKVNNNYGISSMDEMIEYLNKDNINVSVVSSGYNSYEYKDLYEKTGGVYANVSGNFKEELFSIADMIKDDTNNGYWVALNGLIPQLVRLDEKPVINGTCDTDGDSLLDWKELADLQEAKSMDITPFLNKLGFEFTEIDKTIPVYNYISNPVKEDSDGDGLLDGKPLYSDKGEVVAPIDTQPLRKNGTKEIWESHINNINTNVIPDDYCDDFDLGEEVEGILPNTAKRYLSKAEKKLADSLVKAMLKLRGTVNNNDSKIRKTVLFVKNKFEGDPVLGAYILNFIYDDEYIGYHSQPETWQRKFGYNEFYDEVFKIGSFMNDGQLFTNCNGKQYALWMWKGDYWNLQSGSEIGLYEYKGKYSGTDQYDAVDFEVPMKMYLYNYYEENNIENVLNWEPKDKQWWITGFNIRYKEPNPKTMVMIGKIDLSDNKYDDLYKSFANINETIYYDININNIIFDDNKCIWIIWYNKEYVE